MRLIILTIGAWIATIGSACAWHAPEDPAHPADVSAAVDRLSDSDRLVRVNSLIWLANRAPASKVVADKVATSMDDPDMGVRLAAAHCYFVLTGNTKRTIPLLLQGLREPPGRSAHWCDAARTLGEIGPPAKSAVPLLIEMLEGKRESTRATPVYIGPPTPWFHVRWQAARALGQIGPSANAAVPALVKATTQADDGIKTAGPLRVRAARALWLIDARHPQAVTAVVRGLREQYPMNRMAIDTIIMVGPPAKSSVPDLIKALESDHRDVQLAAIDALGIIGAPAEAALPALRAVTADQHPFGIEHARLAVARIGPPEQSAAAVLAAAQRAATDPELREILAERLKDSERP